MRQKIFPTSYCNSTWVDVKIRSILQKVLSCSGAIVNGGWKWKLWSQPVAKQLS